VRLVVKIYKIENFVKKLTLFICPPPPTFSLKLKSRWRGTDGRGLCPCDPFSENGVQNSRFYRIVKFTKSEFTQITFSVFRFLFSETGRRGGSPRLPVPRLFSLRSIEKKNGEGLQKSDSFLPIGIRNAELDKNCKVSNS